MITGDLTKSVAILSLNEFIRTSSFEARRKVHGYEGHIPERYPVPEGGCRVIDDNGLFRFSSFPRFLISWLIVMLLISCAMSPDRPGCCVNHVGPVIVGPALARSLSTMNGAWDKKLRYYRALLCDR